MNRTQTVVLSGASGFIGSYLRDRFEQDGWTVRTIGRQARPGTAEEASWNDDDDAISRVLDGTDLLVNLAGRSVNCRYSARNKAAILDSRVATTAAGSLSWAARCSPSPKGQREPAGPGNVRPRSVPAGRRHYRAPVRFSARRDGLRFRNPCRPDPRYAPGPGDRNPHAARP
ncbi:hypothetical protein DQ354_05410 [Arthrobacter sp. AQ5-06]|nr:hypothetical protein DQ354_05410 [Arthrobacter sp. AQ5-06]